MSKKGFPGKGLRPIRGDDEDNVLSRFGEDGRYQFNAGDGNDIVHGGTSIDYVNAGDGNDMVWTYEGADDIHGGDGNDFIDSGADNDLVKGGDGDDEILAGSGDDEVKGGLGSDIMDGGEGYDIAAGYDELFNYDLTFDIACDPTSLSAILDTRNADDDTLVDFEEVVFKDFTLFTDGTNNNPYAVDDVAAADEDDGSVDILYTDLLLNDTEFECQVMTVTSVDGTLLSFGTVTDHGTFVTYDFGDAFQFLGTGDEAIATFTYTVGDGVGGFGTAEVDVTITGSNDAPILVDEALGSISYTEGDADVIVFSDLTLTDVDDDDMESAKVVITDFVVGDVLAMDGSYTGIVVATYDASTGELELTGASTKADYEDAIEHITYSSTSLNPDLSGLAPTRTLEVTVNDSEDDSNVISKVIDIDNLGPDGFTDTGTPGGELLIGGAFDDVLDGIAGSDLMFGDTGSDVFLFTAGDTAPDFIIDFSLADGDSLHLADLLSGEEAGALEDFLSFTFAGGSTIIDVDVDGAGGTDMTISLIGVDLTAGNTLTDLEVIDDLLASNALIVDM